MTTGEIWMIGDLRSQRQWRAGLRVLAKARVLADAAQAPLALLLLGSAAENRKEDADCLSMREAAAEGLRYGADRVCKVTHPRLEVARTDLHARVLADLARARQPWLVLFALNDFGRETAAFCAQLCRGGMIADCADLQLRDGRIVGRCPAWGGQVLADITLAPGWSTAFVTVQPHGVKLAETPRPQGRIEDLPVQGLAEPQGLELTRRAAQPPEARKLEEAEVVVVGGAGLGDLRGFERVRELAAALGGEVGATRPPVLNHWIEEERLIGQTGKRVRPNLLITIGTSGAVQYTAGIAEARTIVAINRDPKAPIFQWADIGLAVDAETVMPLLVQRAKQTAMRRLADAACVLGTNDGGAPRGGFGHLVRQLRQARGWSEAELAEATGQTPDFIGQVESEVLSPPVSFILRMATAMQVDPGTFLRKEEKTTLRDLRAQAYQRRTREYSYTTLTPEAANSHLRAFLVTIEPHHAHKPVAYKHEGEEFIYVLEGDLEFTLGARAHLLKPGESIHFNSDVPHKLKSLSSQPTRCLVVIYTI